MDNFALTVASDLLLSGPQAYFHETLLESGLGSGFAPGTGYSSSRRETSFAVGLKGVADADVAAVEKAIGDTLRKNRRRGFPPRPRPSRRHASGGARRRARLHQLRSGRRVRRHGHVGARRRRSATLRTPQMAAKLQAAIDADDAFWQKLIRRRFLDNPHKVTVVGEGGRRVRR